MLEVTVNTLNALTPLGLAGGLGYIIYLLVGKRGPMRILASNHLHGLPSMEAAIQRIENILIEIRTILNERK